MKMWRINHDFMPTLNQSYRYIFGKLLKASVVVRYATGAYKCYLHILICNFIICINSIPRICFKNDILFVYYMHNNTL